MRNPFEIKNDIQRDAYIGSTLTPVTKGMRGAIVGAINKATGGDDNRRIVISWLFHYGDGPVVAKSSSNLGPGDWYALSRWLDFYQEDGVWKTRPDFQGEAQLVLTEAIRTTFRTPYKKIDELLKPSDLLGFSVGMCGGVITQVVMDDGSEIDIPSRSLAPRLNELPKGYPPREGVTHIEKLLDRRNNAKF